MGKLDGLGEYDVRRPLTPTGTNLLGLVKHVASMELGYFGDVASRCTRSSSICWLKRPSIWATPTSCAN